MYTRLLHFLSLFFLMLITGVFWGTWFTMTRSIEEFSSSEFTHIGKVIIANVAVPMRFIMPFGIGFVFTSFWLRNKQSKATFYYGFFSLSLITIVLLITLLVLVPIDNGIKEWSEASLPSDWEAIRSKWKVYHAMRTFISLTSFALFCLFVMESGKKHS